MNIFSIGSINNYIKNTNMKMKWQQKKQSGDFTPQTEKERLQQQIDEQHMNNDNDSTLKAIHSKLEQGAELSAYEMNYLRDKEPMTYQKLKNLEAEKKNYEQNLKKCRTKEEVQKLKFSKINESISAIKRVENNPNISDSKKLEIAVFEGKRIMDIEKITTKFVKSEQFKKLPNENEKIKAEKILENAEQNTEEKITKIEAENSPEVRKLKYSKAKSAYTDINEDENSEPIINIKA